MAGRRRGVPEHCRLHLGCGLTTPPGWVNVDKSLTPVLTRVRPVAAALAAIGVLSAEQAATDWDASVVRLDITKGLPWDDGSFDVVYSSHTLEHLSRQEAGAVLGEAHRVLASGGILRVAMPDLGGLVDEYLEKRRGGDATAAEGFMKGLLVVHEPEGSFLRRAAMRRFHRPHRWMYDARSMAALITAAGFERVRECQFRTGECPDLENVETRPDSFFVEATRG